MVIAGLIPSFLLLRILLPSSFLEAAVVFPILAVRVHYKRRRRTCAYSVSPGSGSRTWIEHVKAERMCEARAVFGTSTAKQKSLS